MDPFVPFLKSQFTMVKPLVSSSSALHLLYATGRRNVLSLHATLKLQPLHDIIMLLFTNAWAIVDPTTDNAEALEFDITLGRGSSGFQGDGVGVWAIIDKGVMTNERKRFDMSFARLHESAAMPITHALFSEHSDVTDALLKTPNVGITDLMSNPAAAKVLRALIISDQPAQRPMKGALKPQHKMRTIQLLCRRPATQEDSDAVQAWLQVALNVADLVTRPNVIKPEVQRKLTRTRVEVDAGLDKQYQKELVEDGLAEKTPEEKRAERKRAERAGRSDKELKRQEELEKKRSMRKMQKKGGGMGAGMGM